MKLDNDKEYKAKVVGTRRQDRHGGASRSRTTPTTSPPVTLGDSDEPPGRRVGRWPSATRSAWSTPSPPASSAPRGGTSARAATTTSSRPTPPSTPATPAARCSTRRARSSASTPPSSAAPAATSASASPSPSTWPRICPRSWRTKGKVTRGWLGVMIQKVTPEIAESLDLEEPKGALVADVMKDGPAGGGRRQGRRRHRRVRRSQPVKDSTELPLLVARTPIGKTAKLKVIRDKRHRNVRRQGRRAEGRREQPSADRQGTEDFGLTVQSLTPEHRREPRPRAATSRAWSCPASSRAAPPSDAGMRRGDVIVEVNRAAGEGRRRLPQGVGAAPPKARACCSSCGGARTPSSSPSSRRAEARRAGSGRPRARELLRRLGGGRPAGRPPRVVGRVVAGRGARSLWRCRAGAGLPAPRSQHAGSRGRGARAGRTRAGRDRWHRRDEGPRPDRIPAGGSLRGKGHCPPPGPAAGGCEPPRGPPAGRQPGSRPGRPGPVPVPRPGRLGRPLGALPGARSGRVRMPREDPGRRRRRGLRQGRQGTRARLSGRPRDRSAGARAATRRRSASRAHG